MTETAKTEKPKPSAPVTYEAVVGVEWEDPKTGAPTRVEAGETSDAFPETSVPWLLREGMIALPGKSKKKSKADKAEAEAPAQDAQEAPEPGAATSDDISQPNGDDLSRPTEGGEA